MKARIIFAMVCLITASASGQNQHEIDSLLGALRTASQEDSIRLYHDLAIQWYYFDRNKSLEYSKHERKCSNQLGDSVQILKSQRLRGQIFRHWKQYDSAESILLPLVSIAKRLHRNEELLYLCISLGAINLYTGRYDKCINFYSEAFKLAEIEAAEEQEIKTIILFNMSVLYFKIRDNDRALRYDFNTLVRLRKAGDPRGEIPQLLANISLCYIAKHDFATGEKYLKQAQAELGDKGSEHLKMQMLFNYGMLFQEQQMFDKAERPSECFAR